MDPDSCFNIDKQKDLGMLLVVIRKMFVFNYYVLYYVLWNGVEISYPELYMWICGGGYL